MFEPTSETSRRFAAIGQDPRPVSVIVNGRAKPNRIEEVKLALMKVADPTRANPNCLGFHVYQDRYDPQEFILCERWISEQALLDHGESDYMEEYNAQKGEMFESLAGHFCQEIQRLDVAL